MLSAVAARKAALAKSKAIPVAISSDDAIVNEVDPPGEALAKPANKRKAIVRTERPPPSESSSSANKRRKKKELLPNARPSKADTFSQEQTLESFASSVHGDDSDGSPMGSDIELDEANRDKLQIHPVHQPSPINHKNDYTWSPSRDLIDSSDEEQERGGSLNAIQEDFDSATMPKFKLVLNHTMFRVEPKHISALGLVSSPAVLLLLAPGETACLLGSFLLTVIRGSVSFENVVLRPTMKPHRIFASRLSPLTPLHAMSVEEDTASEGLNSRVPPEMAPFLEGRIILAIQELRTGVEGLQKVCPLFSDAFRLQDDEHKDSLGLDGVYLVSPVFSVLWSWFVLLTSTTRPPKPLLTSLCSASIRLGTWL
jgi:polynucleotide 5'-hydroxyl-kinase GRC3/NOL9